MLEYFQSFDDQILAYSIKCYLLHPISHVDLADFADEYICSWRFAAYFLSFF